MNPVKPLTDQRTEQKSFDGWFRHGQFRIFLKEGLTG